MPLKSQLEISMIKQLNRKRITTKIIRNISDIKYLLNDPEAVFLIQEMSQPLAESISFCNHHNIPVIVLHTANNLIPFLTFSGVYGHPYENSRMILKYCAGAGKSRLALFAFNNVFIDRNYAEAIYNLYPSFQQKDLYQIIYSFDDCFNSFYPNRCDYDSILFANDFVAVAFMKKMQQLDPDYINNHFLIGISDSFISKLFFTTITSITYNRNDIVYAVASIYRSVLRNRKHLVCVNYLLPPELFIRESTQNNPLPAFNNSLPLVTDIRKPGLKFEDATLSYFTEPVLHQISMLENMFSSFNKQDFQILLYMLNGMTNNEISAKLFITLQTLQYHMHQMFIHTGTANKREFIKLVSKYVSAANLEKYLKDPIFS